MATEEQEYVAALMDRRERYKEFVDLDIEWLRVNELVILFGSEGGFITCYGSIFSRYPVAHSMSLFIYNESMLCHPERLLLPLERKTRKSLIQINVETLYIEDDPTFAWHLSTNVDAPAFSILDRDRVFSNGLVIDLKNPTRAQPKRISDD